MKVLMVCLGNICRSPLAQGILERKIVENNLNWTVDSAGTGHWHVGEHPDSRSIAVAKKHGLDISHQRGRQFRKDDLENFDLILVMDKSNYRNVIAMAKEERLKSKVRMIMHFVHPGLFEDVPDPYLDDDGFEAVYEMLDAACERMIMSYILNAPEE